MREDVARDAKCKELDARKQFKVFEHSKGGDISKAAVSTAWVITRKMADSRKCVEARRAAKGYQDPDLEDGAACTPGCVSLRPSHLQFIPCT